MTVFNSCQMMEYLCESSCLIMHRYVWKVWEDICSGMHIKSMFVSADFGNFRTWHTGQDVAILRVSEHEVLCTTEQDIITYL